MDPIIWYLEGPAGSGELRRTLLRPLPFQIGRRSDSDMLLDSSHGSQRHAEFFVREGVLWLRDLGSTNGTAVNGERLTAEQRLYNGDIVHFADREFRLLAEQSAPSMVKTQVFSRSDRVRLEELVRKPQAFREMLNMGKLRTDFQPLVRLSDLTTFGYEVLGRGELDGRDTLPGDLFFIAEKLRREVELSAAFRAKGLELASVLPADQALFVNTHPEELEDCPMLVRSLELLRKHHPSANLVLEIHEAAVTDISSLQELRAALADLDIGLAFDDFGTGQARLLELAEVGPQYLKFDVVLIQDLHQASRKRREMIERLLRMVKDMGIASIAECIENAEESKACTDIGFDIGQGYHLGRPAPPGQYA